MIFFITGMGRSGSLFMANLLQKASNGCVVHETPSDRECCVESYWHPNKSLPNKRVLEIGIEECENKIYGEVSSYLRYQPLFLKYAFDAKIYHLVRDPKNVVRSMMNRNAYTQKDKNHTGRIYPKLGDIFYYRWPQFSRFQRICWYWNDTVSGLLRYKVPVLKFESVLENYYYLYDRLLGQIDLDLSESLWQSEIGRTQNPSRSYQFPDYQKWTTEQKMQFEEICGETGALLGY